MLPKPNNISTSPGVYLFKRGRKPIYIGKAISLKKRVSSYWRNKSPKMVSLLQKANRIEFMETESEVEALLKESELIKKHQPEYNILMRDDKNYFYVGITREEFPKVFITHQPFVYEVMARTPNSIRGTKQSQTQRSPHGVYIERSERARDDKKTKYIGPFTNGSAIKTTLRLLRKTFPYCTCFKPHKRVCLNAQIGRCPGFCCILSSSLQAKRSNLFRSPHHFAPRDDNWRVYRQNIKNIIAVLEGRKKKIASELKRKMSSAAKGKNFELAARIRDQVFGLENIFEHRVVLEPDYSVLASPAPEQVQYGVNSAKQSQDLSAGQTEIATPRLKSGLATTKRRNWPKIENNLQKLLNIKNEISRVEGYDISNISGREATGSMVVFINGQPAKAEYRKFKIKKLHTPDDFAMLKEVVSRRLNHLEWPPPEVMLIDGGRGQLNAILSVLDNKESIPNTIVISLAKREEELYTPQLDKPILLKNLPPETSFFLQHLRNESHRFARSYHHKLREIK